jgi:UPF0271 protein
MKSIDLNCDLGEGYPDDAELMRVVSSANIACGGHAGDEGTIRSTVRLALENGVAIGAHPGYRDKDNFGRKALNLIPHEITELVMEQVALLKKIAAEEGATVSHIKPHGALYNQAADEKEVAGAVVKAIQGIDASLILFGLADSVLIDKGRRGGLRVCGEAFADRRYTSNGRLASRSIEGAVIQDPQAAAEQALKIALGQPIFTIDGRKITTNAQTICLHGDGISAVSTARLIRTFLENNGIEVRPYDQ